MLYSTLAYGAGLAKLLATWTMLCCPSASLNVLSISRMASSSLIKKDYAANFSDRTRTAEEKPKALSSEACPRT
jgi:hypothetical protein